MTDEELQEMIDEAREAEAAWKQQESRLQARILDLEAARATERRTAEDAENKLDAVMSELSRVRELQREEVAQVTRDAEQDAIRTREEVRRLTEALAAAQAQLRDQAAQAEQREQQTITEVETRVRRALQR